MLAKRGAPSIATDSFQRVGRRSKLAVSLSRHAFEERTIVIAHQLQHQGRMMISSTRYKTDYTLPVLKWGD
jgi:hypothetical protein